MYRTTSNAVQSYVTNVLENAEISPQAIKKVVEEFGQSPEKLRASLNLLFVPLFRPTFVDDLHSTVANIQDVDFLGNPEPRPIQSPFRMFDVETGNLVEYPALGALGQYCTLSHRWKGKEVLLEDIYSARKKDLKRAREKASGSEPEGSDNLVGERNDVELILNQCKLKINKQKGIIQNLQAGTKLEGDIRSLLEKREKVKEARRAYDKALNNVNKATLSLRLATVEGDIFKNLIENMKGDIEEKVKGNLHDGAAKALQEKTASARPKNNDRDAIKSVIGDMEEALKTAQKELEKAEGQKDSVKEDDENFTKNSRVLEAVDKLIDRLDKWKSAIKIQKSIMHAKNIFAQNPFQKREKRYFWIDTCCIDKKNGSELSESLSLMGDWYAQAEFTLVQVDSKNAESGAVHDWDMFEENSTDSKAKIGSFADIKPNNPEWAERGWTMQELVMSKTTYYINTEWEALGRPIETIGRFYALVPFIALYTQGDHGNIYHNPMGELPIISFQNLADAFEKHNVESSHMGLEEFANAGGGKGLADNQYTQKEEEGVKSSRKARLLIAILDGLGVQFPKDMSAETARSEMAQAVFLATSYLTTVTQEGKGDSKARNGLLESLVNSFDSMSSSHQGGITKEAKAQHVINLLLSLLVKETQNLIEKDRSKIADFGKIEALPSWKHGTQYQGFSTSDIMNVSCQRTTTVQTDHVYALMGVLNVRFPTFPAEGYAKAMCRLLDEVVITHNDVSVFNWTGMEMGCTIRGRSMYPSSHDAYAKHGDRSHRYNLMLSQEVNEKMNEVMDVYHGITRVLREAINIVKNKEWKNLPIPWIQIIVMIIETLDFRTLKPQLETFGKLVAFFYNAARALYAAPSKPSKDVGNNTPTSPSNERSFAMPGLKTVSSGFSAVKDMKDGKISSVTKGFKYSLGRKKSEPIEQPPAEQEPASPSLSTASTFVEQPLSSPSTLSWKEEYPEVDDYMNGISQSVTMNNQVKDSQQLPGKVQQVPYNIAYQQRDIAIRNDHLQSSSMISPNPIIVNNSGIEGIFDVQRIIVTMIDPDKLRLQVAQSVSPRQKISGWCCISTGFARVLVNFACESQALEKQLNVVEAVENGVLKEQEQDKEKKRRKKIGKGLKVAKSKDENSKDVKASTDSTGHPTINQDESSSNTNENADRNQAQGNKKTEDDDKEKEEKLAEERYVSRMIEFVQEKNFKLVAGEWVLARFSGVAGANWFLCNLELGSTHQFYGHRIATSEIDFSKSAPETGLVGVWGTYMDRKKRKMCSILRNYLKSREDAAKSQDMLDEWTNYVKAGGPITAGLNMKLMPSWGAKSSNAEGASSDKGSEVDSDDDENDGDDLVSRILNPRKLIDDVVAQGKATADRVTTFAVLSLGEKLFEMDADRRDRHLSTSVLKKTPERLRPAVESLSDNRDLLPSMFHSAQRIHMF